MPAAAHGGLPVTMALENRLLRLSLPRSWQEAKATESADWQQGSVGIPRQLKPRISGQFCSQDRAVQL